MFERIRGAGPLTKDEVAPILGTRKQPAVELADANKEQFQDNEDIVVAYQPQTPPAAVSRTVYVLTFCSALSSCNLGFDIGE